jgi:hypothetical protein
VLDFLLRRRRSFKFVDAIPFDLEGGAEPNRILATTLKDKAKT